LTFLEAHLLTEQYLRRVEHAQRAEALHLWWFVNAHRDTQQQREPFGWDEIRQWLGYLPSVAAPEAPEPENMPERMAGFVEYWNAIPDGPQPPGMINGTIQK
jgi:hypothetical protein